MNVKYIKCIFHKRIFIKDSLKTETKHKTFNGVALCDIKDGDLIALYLALYIKRFSLPRLVTPPVIIVVLRGNQTLAPGQTLEVAARHYMFHTGSIWLQY